MISVLLVLSTTAILPNFAFDSFNVSKLLVLTIGSFFLLCILVYTKNLKRLKYFPQIMIPVFLIPLLLTFFFSRSNLLGQFFGTFGRNTGLLAYICLIILACSTFILWDEKMESLFIRSIIFTGAINTIYGILQSLNFDFFSWGNVASPIFGTFGNSNFYGAMIGMFGAVALSIAFHSSTHVLFKFFLVCLILVSLTTVFLSTSNQGILIFLISSSVIFYYRFLHFTAYKKAKIVYIFFVSTGLIFGFLGVINRGPLANILFQNSTLFRGDYWRAGWNIGMDHLFFGAGLDSYGDWYMKYRDQEAYARARDLTSNAAHNVHLDMFANGGIPLFAMHLTLFIIVTVYAFINLYRTKLFSVKAGSISVAWFAFFFQSIVSINNLSVAVWGWSMIGLILGRFFHTGIARKVFSTPSVRYASAMLIAKVAIISLPISVALSIWPIRQDILFKSSLSNPSVENLTKVSMTFPRDDFYASVIAKTFLDNNYFDEANRIAKLALENNPNNLLALQVLLASKATSELQKSIVLEKIRFLNPYFQTQPNIEKT